MFERVTAVRAYERVVEQVEEAIHAGRLRPDERLPSERQLMEQFGVGRSTIREALRVLQSKGLVQSRAGDPNGPVVLAYSSNGLRDHMAALARVDQLTLRELLQFRMTVEGASHRLAAALRTPAHLAALEEAMLRMEEAVGQDEAVFAQADLNFHEVIGDAAGNKLFGICNSVMVDIVRKVVQARISESRDKTAQMKESCRQHRLVLEAVRDGDSERAARLAHQSIFDYYSPSLSTDDRLAVEVLLSERAPASRRVPPPAAPVSARPTGAVSPRTRGVPPRKSTERVTPTST